MFGGLEDHFLHFLNVSGLLAFGGSPSASGLSLFPSISNTVCAASFVLSDNLFEVACSLLVSVVIAVAASLLKAGAFVSGVASDVAELAEGRGLKRGPPIRQCDLAHEGARRCVCLIDLGGDVSFTSFAMVVFIFE